MDTVILTGNTNTKIVFVTKASIKKVHTFRTDNIYRELKKIQTTGNIYLASVVPEATKVIKKFFPSVKEITYRNFPFPIKVKHPEKLGIDRLLNAAGARVLFNSDCLVIDAGSAITIDLVEKDGSFQGGVIFPGYHLLFMSLKNLALLKNVKVKKPAGVIGKDTSEAVGSGLTWGLSFLITGYINHLKSDYPDLKIVFTGGYGRALKNLVNSGLYQKNLTITGIKVVIYGEKENWSL